MEIDIGQLGSWSGLFHETFEFWQISLDTRQFRMPPPQQILNNDRRLSENMTLIAPRPMMYNTAIALSHVSTGLANSTQTIDIAKSLKMRISDDPSTALHSRQNLQITRPQMHRSPPPHFCTSLPRILPERLCRKLKPLQHASQHRRNGLYIAQCLGRTDWTGSTTKSISMSSDSSSSSESGVPWNYRSSSSSRCIMSQIFIGVIRAIPHLCCFTIAKSNRQAALQRVWIRISTNQRNTNHQSTAPSKFNSDTNKLTLASGVQIWTASMHTRRYDLEIWGNHNWNPICQPHRAITQ